MSILLVWRKSGRAWVADVGKLSVIVKERGNAKEGYRWIAWTVFGEHCRADWRDKLGDAIVDAERLVLSLLPPAAKALEEARARGRR